MNLPTKIFSKLTYTRAKQTISVFIIGTVACFNVNTASAFEELNEPQKLIYDTSHLEKTSAGSTITYQYAYLDNANDKIVEDTVLLSIDKERDKTHRDVSLNFLSDTRKLHLPNFENYRGNPVIIGMLEHLAQTMGNESGGGTLYFRNRIKDMLADENLKIIQTDGKSEFSFSPLSNDPYVAERITLKESVITIAFSDDVPGQLLSIEYISGPAMKPEMSRKLVFSDVQAE